MNVHWNRAKLLVKRRSIGGWVLWVLAIGWKRLGDWQNVEWLQQHVLPKAWSKVMLHPDYVTVGLFVAGLVWLTVVAFWPKRAVALDVKPTAEAPHVDVIYALPITHDAAGSFLCRQEPLRLVNTSPVKVAYNVKILPKENKSYRATFEDIPRLEGGETRGVAVEVRGKPSGYFTSFEAVLKFEYEDQPSSETTEVRVPLTVQFSDAVGNLYETKHEISYETFLCEAKTYLVQGTKLMQRPQSSP